MATGLERIAARARCEPNLRFTSLAHHITKERVWENLCEIPVNSAHGVDRQTVGRRRRASGSGLKRCFNVSADAKCQLNADGKVS
jgi:RNA-directed DNA polymerase